MLTDEKLQEEKLNLIGQYAFAYKNVRVKFCIGLKKHQMFTVHFFRNYEWRCYQL
jgi:hypothetical protein